MDDAILITELNDFIFCPVSMYYHKLYGDMDRLLYQSEYQINGTAAHETVDNSTYSTRKDIISAMDVYCEEFNLVGKIDIYDKRAGLLRERKKYIKHIYDGYIYQVYAQCLALREMGYTVNAIELYSLDDHKSYNIPLPEESPEKYEDFQCLIRRIREFNMDAFVQTNAEKCKKCIYEPACDRSFL